MKKKPTKKTTKKTKSTKVSSAKRKTSPKAKGRAAKAATTWQPNGVTLFTTV